ncbi:hypothetical protein NQ317_001119 [Molorchus minor]|uniref:DNA methyltransferase 2 n=1 Tax=Molorchus minor TaxID=1323400 RepID=A0ABQ9JHX5_9CUCU|nr:hypothetical protein NQ317_001119 [Molorchus minor]
MNVLELYSGIGGFHFALDESGVNGKVVASIEINNVANEIYKHNFPETKLYNSNIEGLTSEFINKLNVDTILMSPPCQPFTRNGLQKDIKDPRTASFLHVLQLLPSLHITKLLIENVKGFESSEMRDILTSTLEKCEFVYQEFILSPHQIGIPNSRHRYYCLAKKLPHVFSFQAGKLMLTFPCQIQKQECFPISNILEDKVSQNYVLSDSILMKRLNIMDICHPDSTRSCCFTKAYGRFLEGTGSVFTEKTKSQFAEIIKEVNVSSDDRSKLELIKSLKLRFFTPREICRLMCFPERFTFPDTISDRKKYMVLETVLTLKWYQS